MVEGELVDALWREERVIVELDGYAFHKFRAQFEADRRRDAKLSALARKFADVFGQAAWVAGRSSRLARRSRSARVNFHSNGVAICS